ncbi:hypothetical protein AV521_14730 [Streptomyces sp. IMTB 2501]|uniref:thiolase family protein n=1 Tax=Streptomyces sp. IMTB 2501 TaxID=1776340 RepID=UPI00096C5109|nr:hypothetical protein [Streptomyces sp. IMTB 2501]OLZ70387.1 hypothetical protein AV521_14730 [Streptomyces sp. IMTB 2501]
MNTVDTVYLVDAVRTPVRRHDGALASVRPDDLAAHAILERPARMAALPADLPAPVPGVTVNGLCARRLEAVIQAARAIALGDVHIAAAGGVESTPRAPYVLPRPHRAFPARHAAREQGLFEAELMSVPVPRPKGEPVAFAADECVRPDVSPESTAGLKPSFRGTNGTVTAGDASPLHDGTAALLLADEEDLKATGREPLARTRATGVSATYAHYFRLALAKAVNRAPARAGKEFDDPVRPESENAALDRRSAAVLERQSAAKKASGTP